MKLIETSSWSRTRPGGLRGQHFLLVAMPTAPITALSAVALPTDSSQPFSTSPRTPSLMPPAPTAHVLLAPQQPPSSLPATPPCDIAAASSITSNSMVGVTASTSNAAATAMPHPLRHVVVEDWAENGSVAINYQWHQLQSDYWILHTAAAMPHPAPSFSDFSYVQDRDEEGMHCEEAL